MLSATKKWLLLKLSSVIMVPFMIWFLIKIVTIHDKDYQNIKEFFSDPSYAIIFQYLSSLHSFTPLYL